MQGQQSKGIIFIYEHDTVEHLKIEELSMSLDIQEDMLVCVLRASLQRWLAYDHVPSDYTIQVVNHMSARLSVQHMPIAQTKYGQARQ